MVNLILFIQCFVCSDSSFMVMLYTAWIQGTSLTNLSSLRLPDLTNPWLPFYFPHKYPTLSHIPGFCQMKLGDLRVIFGIPWDSLSHGHVTWEIPIILALAFQWVESLCFPRVSDVAIFTDMNRHYATVLLNLCHFTILSFICGRTPTAQRKSLDRAETLTTTAAVLSSETFVIVSFHRFDRLSYISIFSVSC